MANWYPNSYGNMVPGYSQGQVSYGGYPMAQAPMQMNPQNQSGGMMNPGMIWVDGEVGAKAYQIQPGQTTPVALWDTNDQVIYLKSVNQMGMPNPIQKVRYQIEEMPQQYLTGNGGNGGGNSGSQGNMFEQDDRIHDEISSLRQEIRELKEAMSQRQQGGSQNVSQSRQNGGNNGGGNRNV